MPEPHVLFLALGGNRRRAAEDEAKAIIARGGSATIALRGSSGWRKANLDGIRVIDVRELELRHAWMPATQLILRRLPRRAFRLVGRGPLRQRSAQGLKVYQRRIADPLHLRVFLPMLQRRRDASAETFIRRQLGNAKVDLLVVNDAASMPVAVALLRQWRADAVPEVAYGIDHFAPAAPAPPVRHGSGQPQGER